MKNLVETLYFGRFNRVFVSDVVRKGYSGIAIDGSLTVGHYDDMQVCH